MHKYDEQSNYVNKVITLFKEDVRATSTTETSCEAFQRNERSSYRNMRLNGIWSFSVFKLSGVIFPDGVSDSSPRIR